MNRLFVNGQEYTADVSGLDELEIEIGLNTSTKTIGKTLSSEMTATGELYQYLAAYFFSTCDDWQKTLKANFRTDICGGIDIECEITSEGLEQFEETKEIKFNLKSSDEVSKGYARLDSEIITSNGFMENTEIPIVYYVDQPNYLSWVLFYLTVTIRIVFNTIDAVLKALCNAITLGFIDDLLGFSCNDINITGAIFSAFDTRITGAGRWAPSPLVREMINYQCDQVGFTFVSSILNDPASSRYNLSLFCLTGGENGDFEDISKPERVRLLDLNSPIYTTIGLLDELSQVFAADYRIIGKTLYFEPLEFFNDIRTQKIFNLKDVCPKDTIGKSYNIKSACAYGQYSYTPDSFDQEGNGVLKQLYEDQLEFNLPYNPVQKGKCTRQLNFAPARFMFDKPLFEKKGFFNFRRFMDEFRDGPDTFFADVFFDNEGVIRKYDLILSSGMLSNHKLLVLENGFDRNDAKVMKVPFAMKDGKQYWNYNTPMHIDEQASYNELAKDFYYADNPRLKKDIYKFTDIEIECSCDFVKTSIKDFQTIFIESKYGKMIPGSVNIQFKANDISMTFQDIVGIC